MRHPRITRQVADSAGELYDFAIDAVVRQEATMDVLVEVAVRALNHSMLAERGDQRFKMGLRLLDGGDLNRELAGEAKSLERWCSEQKEGPTMVEIVGPSSTKPLAA